MILGVAVFESGWLYLFTSGALFLLAGSPLQHEADGGWFSKSLPPVLSCVASYYFTDLYDIRVVGKFRDFCSRLPRALGLASGVLLVYYLAAPTVRVFPGLWSSTLAALFVVVALSVPLRWALAMAVHNPPFSERVLILGSGPLARRVAEKATASKRYTVLGSLDDSEASRTLQLFPAHSLCSSLGSLDRLRATVDDLKPHRIIVGLTERRSRMPIQDLLEYRARGVVIEEASEAYERLAQKLAIESLTPSALIFSELLERSRGFAFGQRLLSVIVAAVGAILTAPIMLLVALLIKLDSKGPVFFIQSRAGLQGKPFGLVKFRTMHVAPEGEQKSFWAADNDDRITRVGGWLRRFRLDELPQFVNILHGDMNLIGPRPHPTENAALFRKSIPYYPLRERVHPGLTGWAQIRNGYANGLAQETEKMRYDLYYIKNRSLWMDVRILLDTVKIVLTAEGS